MIRHAVLMAAGRGRRMMPLTDVVPKPMAPFRGSTLIAAGLARLAGRIESVHVTVGYKGAMLAQHVIEHGARSVFNTEGRPNAWWIHHTPLSLLDEPVYVLTCDNVVELDWDRLERDYRDLGQPPCLIVPVRPVPGLEGDYIFRDGAVVTRLSRTQPSDIYCSGIQILNPRAVTRLTRAGHDFYGVWQQLIDQRRLRVGSVYPLTWFAVDTVEQLMALNSASAA